MKGRILGMTLFFSLLLAAAVLLLSLMSRGGSARDVRAQQILDMNEISRLMDAGEYDLAREKADAFQDFLRTAPAETSSGISAPVMCVITIGFMAMVFFYVYFRILRPFDKMKGYAAEIARGNFDVSLRYERADYFGAFTWAFDSMRKEILRSRAAEREAVENNKTVIATLSHDIKTPIASIRAYAEGLEANMDTSPERRAKYVSVIMKKCDEVTRLTNDLFLHSLSDLDKLQVQPEELEAVPFLEETVAEISGEQGDVVFLRPDFSPVITADPKRLTQILENLINNSRKYARSEITVFLTCQEDMLELHVLDRGSGIPDEDMPFITEKFYRGHNCGKENGSGLGLYIVKYIARKSGGDLILRNRTGEETGLEAVVTLPVKIR